MKNLAVLLRALQLSAHVYHNVVKGPQFFSDHEFLGSMYGTYENAYDSVVERIIGTSGMEPAELFKLQQEAAKLLAGVPVVCDSAAIFAALISGESELREHCKAVTGSIGTLNLVAQLADDSEVRSYKLKQRIK